MDVQQFSEVRGGASYLSQNDLRLHFGVGTASRMESVQVRWPNGATELFRNLDGEYIYTIVEG
jgi:enediyne biosynthesis protein E4